MRKLINIELYAKVMLTVIAVCLVGVCTGMDREGNMPAAFPLDIPDGAYARPGRTWRNPSPLPAYPLLAAAAPLPNRPLPH